MNYRISETPLRLREFGRNIQAMVEFAQTIEDKDERNKIANEIVRIMSNLNPSLKEFNDYKQKLWDALFLISDFKLEVDSPFELPEKADLFKKEEHHMPYYKGKPKYKQYGWNVQLMVKKAIDMEEGPEKEAYLNLVANTMKQFLRNMDRETTPEEVIAEHMREMSAGKLDIKGENLTITKSVPSHSNNHHNGRKNNNKGRRSSNKRRRK